MQNIKENVYINDKRTSVTINATLLLSIKQREKTLQEIITEMTPLYPEMVEAVGTIERINPSSKHNMSAVVTSLCVLWLEKWFYELDEIPF